MKRQVLGTAVAALVFAGSASPALAAEPDAVRTGKSDAPPVVVDAVVITEVSPLGYTVAGLAVKYSGVVELGGAASPSTAYSVHVTLAAEGRQTVEGARTVVSAYTNSAPEFSDQAHEGNWVILELDTSDEVALAAYNNGTYTRFYDLVGAYEVSQLADIGERSRTIPGRPDIVVANSAVESLVVDEYAAGSFTATSGSTLPYRLFTPEKVQGERRVPLVVALHGYGESGTDNFGQIAGNQISSAFADPERQATAPAFVLSPQANPSDPAVGGWFGSSTQASVIELVEHTIEENPAIDPDRVYLTGLSMGSYGSWGILLQRDDLFAGGLLVCGNGGDETAVAAAVADFPIWAVHSEDDSIVAFDAPGSDYRIFQALAAAGEPVVWSAWSGLASDQEQERAASAAISEARQLKSEHIFTTLPAGTTPLFDHGSWIPTYSNAAILDWLFSHERGQ